MTMARSGIRYPIISHSIKLRLACKIVVMLHSYILRGPPVVFLTILTI